jgi:hypothetical protein
VSFVVKKRFTTRLTRRQADKKELRATERLLSKHKAEIERKNQIIAELTGEILDLKKELGDI